jgi:hypothetical protein
VIGSPVRGLTRLADLIRCFALSCTLACLTVRSGRPGLVGEPGDAGGDGPSS